MSSPRTLILECGDNRVSIASFSTRGSRICLHRFETHPFADTENLAGSESWLAAVGVALKSLAGRTKISGAVVLVIPAHLTLTKFIKIPRVASAQQEKIISFEASQNIPYALNEVVWGSVVIGESETESEVVITAAKLDLVQALLRTMRDAGFEPQKILPAGFTTLAAFRAGKTEMRQNFLGVNIGVQSTTLALIEADRFALRTLNIESSSDSSASAVTEIFAAKLQQEITRSSLHFQWKHGLAKPTHFLLGGSVAGAGGLTEVLKTKLKVTAEIIAPTDLIDFADDAVKAKAMSAGGVLLLDLIGGALTQLRTGQPAINLIPPDALRTMNDRKRRPILIVAAIATAAILIPPIVHFRNVSNEVRIRIVAIEQVSAPLRARDFRNQENLRQIDQLKQRLQTIADLGERRGSWLRLMGELQEQLAQVEDVWFDKLQVVPAKADSPLKLSISGRMLDRAQPLSRVSPGTYTRVKTLLSRLAELPSVAAIEAERFDHQQAGIFKFDFVLVTEAKRPI